MAANERSRNSSLLRRLLPIAAGATILWTLVVVVLYVRSRDLPTRYIVRDGVIGSEYGFLDHYLGWIFVLGVALGVATVLIAVRLEGSPPSDAPVGWYPDPHRRHEMRYWSGSDWTEQVSDQGVTSVDPVGPSNQPLPGK